MVTDKSPKAKKQTASKIVVMSKMDFEIATLVYQRFTAIGITDEEVAFLLGKRNKYVFDLLDPTQKDKFKTEQLDILPTILECKIRHIIPNDIRSGETVKIRATKKVYLHKIVYQYTILHQDDAQSKPVIIIKNITKGLRKKLHPQVHELTSTLLQEGQFDTPQNALSLYLIYRKRITTVPFSPSDLQKSLAACLRSDQETALLSKEIIDARYYYNSVSRG